MRPLFHVSLSGGVWLADPAAGRGRPHGLRLHGPGRRLTAARPGRRPRVGPEVAGEAKAAAGGEHLRPPLRNRHRARLRPGGLCRALQRDCLTGSAEGKKEKKKKKEQPQKLRKQGSGWLSPILPEQLHLGSPRAPPFWSRASTPSTGASSGTSSRSCGGTRS